jgi:hypothetical protein
MYLSTYLPDKSQVIAAVAAMPKAAQMEQGALFEAAVKRVQALVVEKLTYELHISVSDAVAQYEAVNGRYDAIPPGEEGERARDEYESGLDDVVESVFEDFQDGLSQNWLGQNTIDSRVWEDDGPQRLATSAAKEVWKTLTTDKTPAQILANAGIVATDFDDIATLALTQHTTPQKDTATMAEQIEVVLLKIKQHVGTSFDVMSVYEDMETIFDEEDETLVQSAASRLGLTMEDVPVLQIAALEYDDAPDELTKLLANTQAGPKPARARAPKATAPAAPVAGQIDGNVLEALKSCGAGETSMAEALGVSRSTFVNYTKNKTPFVPDDEQRKVVRGEVVARANMMLAALATLDGTERAQVQ